MISLSRIMGLWHYYHAPMTAVWAFETKELPRLFNVSGLLPVYSGARDDEQSRIDLSPVKYFDLKLCVAKEWHRFPGHYYVPDGVRVEWIKSEFDGMLPGHFKPTPRWGGLMARLAGTHNVPHGLNDLNKEEASFYVSGFCPASGTELTSAPG